jgi:NAD(P)-dependent dehydrogenase (short-subunit alcohol dehydrogenase family)
MAEALRGKVALVTGGSRGIGKAIAVAFSREGALLAIAARTEGNLAKAAEELAAIGPRPLTIAGDVSVEADAARMVRETVGRYGRLDILVASAGICILGPVKEFRVADWDRLMATNARGTFLCCREAVRQMLAQEGTSQIINVVSNQGIDSVPNVAAYGATKHAVMGFTRSLNQEVQPLGIRVSALCPMLVDTKMRRDLFPDADGSRWLDPSEIGEAAVFMATRPFLGGMREMVVGLYQELGGTK